MPKEKVLRRSGALMSTHLFGDDENSLKSTRIVIVQLPKHVNLKNPPEFFKYVGPTVTLWVVYALPEILAKKCFRFRNIYMYLISQG